MLTSNTSILALDVGGVRIGVASANGLVRIAQPLTTLAHDATIESMLHKLIADTNAVAIVVGLPRGLDGQYTNQTHDIERFVDQLKSWVAIPVYWQDEALTSQKAESELQARGKPFAKGDIDALAATYILEDFLQDHPGDNMGEPA